MTSPRIAVLFDNFGPYHIARLSAAATRCDLLGIEVSSASAEYAWQPTESVPFERITLFKLGQGEKKKPQDIEKKLGDALSKRDTEALVIPGWSSNHALIAIRIALQRSIPVILMSESQEADFHRTWIKEWIKRRYVKMCNSALVGGNSHKAYMQKLGMPESHIFTGYDVVDNDYFLKGAQIAKKNEESNRRKYGLPEKYFLASSRFIEKKNLPLLISAYREYLDEVINQGVEEDSIYHLVILGDGELRGILENLVDQKDLADKVHMPGFKQYNDLPMYYGLASLFIHASTTEQWGLVVNEAMASGLPVLVSDRCGCTGDLVAPGTNGYTFSPDDRGELTNLMINMVSADVDLTIMGESSRKIISKWSPASFGEGLLNAVKVALSLPVKRLNIIDTALLSVLTFK
jgi:glycosyltransferase involved in cell wall biosynthesis